MDTKMIVNLAITGIVLLFVLAGMFWGLIRGLKKTAIRSVWILVTSALLIFVLSRVITQALINMNITITYDGEQFNGFAELLTHIVESSLESSAGSQNIDMTLLGDNIDIVVKTLLSYITIFLNSIVFVILFWLTKIVLLPINWIFTKWVFVGKKEKQYRRELKEYKNYIKEYNKLNKGKKSLEAVGFASIEENNDKKLVEDELVELKKEKEDKNLKSLKAARKSFEDMRIRMEQEKQYKKLQEEKIESNELLDRPYVEKKEKVEEVVEETYVPVEEYVPTIEEKLKELKPVKKPKKLKKHRGWGMLVGGVLGLFISAMTLSPIVGVMNVANTINSDNEIVLEDDSKVGILDYLLMTTLDTTDKWFSIINDYYSSAIGTNALRYTGSEWVATTTFKALTKAKIDGVDVDLTNDVSAIIGLANEVNKLTKDWEVAQTNNYALYTLTKVTTSLRKIVDLVFEVSIISLLTEPLIDMAVAVLSKEDNNEQILVQTTPNDENTSADIEFNTDEILLAVADGLSNIDSIENLKNELKAIIKIVEELNYGVRVDGVETSLFRELLISSMGDGEGKIFEVIQKANYDFYNQNESFYFVRILNNLYEVDGYRCKIASSIIPITMDYVFKLLLKEISLGDIDVNFAENGAEVRTMLTNIFTEAFNIMLHFNTGKDSEGNPYFIDLNDEGSKISLRSLNISVFTSIGKIVNELTSQFDEEQHEQLMNSLADMICEVFETSFSSLILEEDLTKFTNNVRTAIVNLDNNSIVSEFTALGKFMNYLFVGESIINEQTGELEEVHALISGDLYLGDQENWELNVINLSCIPNLLDAMQDLKMFSYKAEGEKLNTATYFVAAFLSKTQADIASNLDEEALSNDHLDEDGYIASESITDINAVLWNVVSRIKNNLNENVNTTTGAYNWNEDLKNQSKFFEFLEEVIDGAVSLDLISDNSVIKLLIDDKYTEISDATKLTVIDKIGSTKLFDGVFDKFFKDMSGVVCSSLNNEDSITSKIQTIINKMFNRLSSAKSYYQYLNNLNTAMVNANNNGIVKNGEFVLDINSVENIYYFGAMLDDLTRAKEDEKALLDHADIKDVIVSILDDDILNELAGEDKIIEPVKGLLITVKNSIEEGNAVTAIYNKSTWAEIFASLIKISNIDFNSLNETAGALSKLGEVLDVLTAKGFALELKDEEVKNIKVEFAQDIDAKKCIIGLMANSIKDFDDLDTSIIDVVYSVYNYENRQFDTHIQATLDFLNSTSVEVDAEGGAKVGLFTYYNENNTLNKSSSGMLENIYNQDFSELTWKEYCEGIAEDVESLENGEMEIGKFAYTDGGKTYSYYPTNQVSSVGIETTIYNMVARENAILTIDHVKYIIKSKISVGDEASSFITNVLSTINNNVNSLTKYNLITEFKSLQYFKDFASAEISIDNIPALGGYLDELANSKLFEGVGRQIALGVLKEIGEEPIINRQTDPSLISIGNSALYGALYDGSYDGTTSFVIQEEDGLYLDTSDSSEMVKYINDHYNNSGTNADLCSKLKVVNDNLEIIRNNFN